MYDEFYSLTEKGKNILKGLCGFRGRSVTNYRRLYGSLTMFQES